MFVVADGKNTGFENVVHYARAACGMAGGFSIVAGFTVIVIVTLASYTVIVVTLLVLTYTLLHLHVAL